MFCLFCFVLFCFVLLCLVVFCFVVFCLVACLLVFDFLCALRNIHHNFPTYNSLDGNQLVSFQLLALEFQLRIGL